LISPWQRNTRWKGLAAPSGDLDLYTVRIELGTILLIGNVKTEDLMTKNVFSIRQLTRNLNCPCTVALLTTCFDQLFCPVRSTSWIESVLLNLDPDISTVSFEICAPVRAGSNISHDRPRMRRSPLTPVKCDTTSGLNRRNYGSCQVTTGTTGDIRPSKRSSWTVRV